MEIFSTTKVLNADGGTFFVIKVYVICKTDKKTNVQKTFKQEKIKSYYKTINTWTVNDS